jgi:hypothetical protein
MAQEVHAAHDEASMTGLLRGIINDIGDLIRHEIRFARTEFRSDLRNTTRAATVLALGAGTAVLGAFLLGLMLVHLLHWLSLPAGTAESSHAIPLWGCFGIVSAVFLAIGSGVAYAGCQMLASTNPLPDQTAQNVKENVEWIANSR